MPGALPALGRALGLVLVTDLVVAAAVGLLGWALGWSTREAWGSGFVWAGLAAAALGGLVVSGAWQGRLAHVGYAASAGPASLAERTRLAVRDVDAGYRRILFLLAVALPLVALGLWLDPRV